MMHVIVSNKDSQRHIDWHVWKDSLLWWWLKIYVIQGNYHSWIKSPNSTPTKYFRIVHKGKIIFLSSSGKKTLHELGIQDGDLITIGGVEFGESDRRDRTTQTTDSGTSKSKSKSKSGKSNKSSGLTDKKKKALTIAPLLTEDQMVTKHRETHSRAMTRVLDELNPLLKSIRNRMNDLAIHKAAPKVRNRSRKTSQQQTSSVTLLSEHSIGGKAGKVAYPILVGEVTNLCKGSKHPTTFPIIAIDLHGYSKDKALDILDEHLLVWVDIAMRGEYPWVIPVDIICGGGSQILSAAVKGWTRGNRQVANRGQRVSSIKVS